MSTLTTFNTTDSGATIRAGLNDNFSALNTDKIETSVLDTDETLAANSDSKIATQKAVKSYVANNSSITATQLSPMPDGGGASLSFQNIASNTTVYLGRVLVPFTITANSVSIYITGVSVAGTLNIALFSSDGATRLFNVTTASISGSGTVTTALSSVVIPAGVYYLAVQTVGTANINMSWYERGISGNIAMPNVNTKSKPYGTLSATASTMPSTIDPTGLTVTGANTTTIVATLTN